jgi:hypothetical protein
MIDTTQSNMYFFDLASPANFGNDDIYKNAAISIIEALSYGGSKNDLKDIFIRSGVNYILDINEHNEKDYVNAMFLLGRNSTINDRAPDGTSKVWFVRIENIEAYWNANYRDILPNLALAIFGL